MRAELPAVLTRGPFTTAEAYALGLTPRTLQGPAVRRVFHGVYLDANLPLTEALRTAAAFRALPAGSVGTGVTALWMFGVDVGSPDPLRFCGLHPAPVARPGIRYSRVRVLPPTNPSSTRARLATPEAAFLAASTDLDLVELVVAGDWLVRRGRTSPDDLVAYVGSASGRGVRVARRAAALVRRRVDSVPETRLRLCLVLAGLPEPSCNIGIESGMLVLGKGDLVYTVFRTVIEYEGDQHRTDKRQWNIDIDRVDDFSGEGFRVIRVTAQRMRRPQNVVQRVFEAIRAGGYRGPEPVFTAEWLRLFSSDGKSTQNRPRSG